MASSSAVADSDSTQKSSSTSNGSAVLDVYFPERRTMRIPSHKL